MMRYMFFLANILCACITVVSPSHATSCAGRIMTGTVVTGKTQYDPFSATPVSDSYEITVMNAGAVSCIFALSLSSTNPNEARLGKTLLYTILNSFNRSVPITHIGAPPATMLLSPAVAPNATYVFRYYVAVERGQFAAPATYGDSLSLELYNFDGGQIKHPRLDAKMLSIAYMVPQSLSVNLKGGDLSTTLGFEPFTMGAQRSVLVETRSNLPYQLNVSSENNGVMVLAPRIPGKDWSVNYAASMDGRSLDLRKRAVISGLPHTSPRSDAVFNLAVSIGDVARKRAGRYEDTITIEIVGASP
jgi:hypothetical protein